MTRLKLTMSLLFSIVPLGAQTRYVVTDLGSLGGVNPFEASASPASAQSINNAGQVAGYSYLPNNGGTRGFRTAPNSPINPATDAIPTLGGTSSAASAINSSGQVAGYAKLANGHTHAMRVDADGSVHDLGLLSGTVDFSLANGINDLGQVAGASWHSTPASGAPCFSLGGSVAFETAANSAMGVGSDLGTLLSNCRGSDGYAIDASGRVVGYSAFGNVGDPVQHAMVYIPGTGMRDLGVLGGSVRFPAASGINAVAYGINSSGQIVGQSTYNGAPDYTDTHAFLTTTAGGPMTDLGTLGGSFSAAFGINTLGQAVGSATTTGDAALHAFIYSGGVMNDLNASLPSGTPWLIQSASSINDNGQIVASAELNDNTQHAVRVDPADVATSILINLLSSPSLNLTSGQVSSLTDKLNNAIASIQSGLYKQATNQLNSFIGAVQTQVKVGKLSSSAGTQLVAAANVIIAAIS